MFRFPSPSLSWRWVGRSGQKKKKKKKKNEWTHERGLGATESRAAKYESLEIYYQGYQMSKKATKTKYRW